MKRPSYRAAVAWVAGNDDPGVVDVETVRCMVTVGLVADLFGVEVERVAADVVKLRRRDALRQRTREARASGAFGGER